MNNCCIKRVITIKEPISFHIIGVWDDTNNDYAKECKFSWSSNGVCYTDWSDYDTYINICSNLHSDFFLKILINRSLKTITFDSLQVTCFSIELYSECQFDKDVCSNVNLFNPYANMECAIALQQQMADNIICIFGTPIYYFKVAPVQSSADYTFKEYVLHEVQSVKQIKMIFPADSMPSSKPVLSEFDFDWENDWDVEISKKQFALAFGDDLRPSEKDFLYCPMTEKMYQVNGAWQEREKGIMYQASTWKLALRKWEDDSALSKGAYELPIDDLVGLKYEEVFGEAELQEQERESGIGQVDSPTRASNTLYNIFTGDAIRKSVAKDIISIKDAPIWHKSIQLSYNKYTFNGEGVAVTYQKKFCGDEGTIILLLNGTPAEGQLISIGSYINLSIKTENDKFYICEGDKLQTEVLHETNIIILSWSRDLMTESLLVIPIDLFKYTNLPKYKIKPQMYECDFSSEPKSIIFSTEKIIKNECDIFMYASCNNICYFKLFDNYMNKEHAITEALKYTTVSEHCIINDLARPYEGTLGFSVK